MKSRRGVSLIELLLIMSACTVILTMSAALMHRVMHTHSKARAFGDVERTSLRLANQFRQDVHAANDANVGTDLGKGVILRLQLPGEERIEYGHRQGKVTRVTWEANKATSREEFAFPAEIELQIRRNMPRMVLLSITSLPINTAADSLAADAAERPMIAFLVPVSLQVEAMLGRNRDFAAAPASQEGSR
jgi:hypothetical protein